MLWLVACAFHVPPPDAGDVEPIALVPRDGENRPFVRIDGETWLLDTGYSRTTCDDAWVAARGVKVAATAGRAVGEAGAVKVGRAVLDGVTVGGWHFARMPCAVRDLQTTSSVGEGVVGVLGSNVLRHFRLDLGAELRLERDEVERPSGAATLRPELGLGPRRVATLDIDGARVTVVIDTGADRTYLPLDDGAELARYTGRKQGTGPTGGVEVEIVFRSLRDATIGPLDLQIASYVERPKRPCGTAAWLPTAWRTGGCPFTPDFARYGLLGMDAMGTGHLRIDYRGGWMVIE